MRGKDLLTVAAIPRAQIFRLLQIARDLKAAPRHGRASQLLAGLTLGLLFEKPSTRTRVSFEAGMNQLGGQALFLSSDNIQLSRGESLADTAKVLSRYLDGLVVRTYQQAILEEWAHHASIPVINGLTDLCHPCQALADLLTISEKKGRLEGIKLAYIGDGNNIANSLIEASAKVGMHITVGCPPGYEPDRAIIQAAGEEAQYTGSIIEITHDPQEAASNADVLYTDVWTSMGQEHEHAHRVAAFSPYQVNESLLARACRDAIVMHCLPAHRGEEITAAVLDGPQSVVLDQAENRLHMQKAILTEWLGRPWA
ncbi:MAG: ornithine carbamoyltransferase [Nitrospirae bacterium]|nr:MAG: ornithine carbamoyltransferase [Nitrospirota bacterium]